MRSRNILVEEEILESCAIRGKYNTGMRHTTINLLINLRENMIDKDQ